MKLTNNFCLNEFTDSETASRKGYDNIPSEKEIEKLKNIAEKILQPLRDLIGVPIKISSGFRCKKLNDDVGSNDYSQHLVGEAVDIKVYNMDLKEVYKIISANFPEFHQLIFEYNNWIHIGLKGSGNRREKKVFEWVDGKKVKRLYTEGEF